MTSKDWRDRFAAHAWPGEPFIKEDDDGSDFDEALARVNEILSDG